MVITTKQLSNTKTDITILRFIKLHKLYENKFVQQIKKNVVPRVEKCSFHSQ